MKNEPERIITFYDFPKDQKNIMLPHWARAASRAAAPLFLSSLSALCCCSSVAFVPVRVS
jgi:hypothetical protein